MQAHRSISDILETITGGLAVPRLAKAGVAVIAVGLLVDLVAHAFGHPGHDELLGTFPLEEHLAHLVVVLGMVLVLAGIVADGIRSQRRPVRQEGTARHAIR